jgi:hypothetical protein
MSGSGNIEINCSNNLIARYLFRRHRIKGDPKPKDTKVSGSGRISQNKF